MVLVIYFFNLSFLPILSHSQIPVKTNVAPTTAPIITKNNRKNKAFSCPAERKPPLKASAWAAALKIKNNYTESLWMGYS